MKFLAITTPAGLALLGLALLTMKKRPHWHKTIAIMMFLAGIGLAGILGVVLILIFGLLGQLFVALAHALGHIPVLPVLVAALPLGLRWVVGLVLLAWFVYDMWPHRWRGSAHRRGRGGRGGRVPDVTNAGGAAAHVQGSRHTWWVALFVASAWVLLPPLGTLVGIG